jgi:Ni,Fe-hydrogenase III large subunit
VAERLPRLDLPEALDLVARICGSCSIAHSLAFCMALEQICGLSVGERAMALRCGAAELERAAAHLGGVRRTLESLGMARTAGEFDAHMALIRQVMALVTGAESAAAFVLPGGVGRNLASPERDELLVRLPKLNRAVLRSAEQLIDSRALLARTVEVGVLPRSAAEQFGLRGPAARASGIARDARFDKPYEAYANLPIKPIAQEGGDVFARLVLLLLEAFESLKIVEHIMRELPDGKWQGRMLNELPPGKASAQVEAPRGPLRYTLRSAGGRLSEVANDPPRQLDRLLVRTLLSGALIDNVVAIIASADHCSACSEA